MRETLEDVVRAVAKTLDDDVLPALEPRSWPASRVRSVLSLLQHALDRAENERRILIAGNALMRGFLEDVRAGAGPAPSGLAATGELAAVLRDFAELGPDAETAALARANDAYKEALIRLVRGAAERRRHGAANADAVFRAALHRVLAELHGLERVLTGRAAGMPPV